MCIPGDLMLSCGGCFLAIVKVGETAIPRVVMMFAWSNSVATLGFLGGKNCTHVGIAGFSTA